MERILDNKKSKVSDILQDEIRSDSKISVISAYFTIFAFDKLKTQLKNIDSLRFLFIEPTFIKTKEEQREFYINKLDRERQISGTEYEIKLRNELTQSVIARECADWIRNKAEFKSLKTSNAQNMRAIHVQNISSVFGIQGTLDFTSTGLGFSSSQSLSMNMYTNEPSATNEMLKIFDDIWNNKEIVQDVKEEVIKSIQNIYKENTPEFLYFVTLYNIFKEYLDELTEDNIVKTKTGFKNTLVWNKLYKFQKDGVIGTISKLEKYNGCIIADSVGLGKTFEALAVIKYYELRNCRTLVLCPKKLRDNWNMYRANDVRNILSNDRFSYDILNHTDLSRYRGMSGDINLETVNWGNYDLVVIDESHNFRNNDPRKDKKTRYQRLMDNIIKSGVKTKVLMLSATPVNNKMNDLKNQIYFITEGKDNALNSEGIVSIESALRRAQYIFNNWLKTSGERNLEGLLQRLNIDYFKLLDLLTIARSRKHIQKYYDISEIGKFPIRLKPENIKSNIDILNQFPELGEINSSIASLKLAIYSPIAYVLPHKKAEYDKKYDMEVKNGASVFKQEDRERNIVNLMRVNILKRMESSIHSFGITLNNICKKIDFTLNNIDTLLSDSYKTEIEDAEIDEDDDLEDIMTNGSIQIKLKDMDLDRWKNDLEKDKAKIVNMIEESKKITQQRDQKLKDLRDLISKKINNQINPGNKKVVIFTAFSDTANYLYKNISEWALNNFGIHSALVTGSGCKVTNKQVPNTLSFILTNFSPISKEKDKICADIKEDIDILIATDCVSEGQNLQDCDCLVNYDIHWNPVRIIQRFGRIDRIGSKNEYIKLVNFWPNMELDEYIKLEARVRGRMVLVNSSATGEEDIINETEQDVMNDLEYRKNQLIQLQEEVLDLEDISGGISITDLTMSDFKMDLVEYMKDNKDILDKTPLGMYAITGIKDSGLDDIKPGIIFTLRQVSFSDVESKEQNALHPYYMVYIQEDGFIKYTYLQTKYILDIYKKLCHNKNEVLKDLVKVFDSETNEARNMSKYSDLLKNTIINIIGKKQDDGISSIFSLGKTSIANDNKLSGLDDFELVSFLIIK